MGDYSNYTIERLESLLSDYKGLGQIDNDEVLEILAEIERRNSRLDFGKSAAEILSAARQHLFISYKDVALASGVDWKKARRPMPGHLFRLLEYCHRKKWPLITAIVVSIPHLRDGKMDSTTLKGFCDGARKLGYPVVDEAGFLEQAQISVFDWATRQ